jgi:hypothetical protein
MFTKFFHAQKLAMPGMIPNLPGVAVGIVTIVLASGGFMLLPGIALGATGFALLKIAKE